MKKKLIILGILLLVIVNLSALATIGYHRCFGHGDKSPNETGYSEEGYLCQQLSLSKSQAEKMKTLESFFHMQADKIDSTLLKKRSELVELLMVSKPDSEKISATLKDIESTQAELQKQVIYYLLKEKEILTPEQQKKFFSIIKQRLLREASHHQTNGLDSIENIGNSNCPQINNSFKN